MNRIRVVWLLWLGMASIGVAAEKQTERGTLVLSVEEERDVGNVSGPPVDKISLACVASAGAIVIDGTLEDWGDCPGVDLGGTPDLGGRFWVAVDRSNLFLAFAVRDDVFSQPHHDGDIWQGDSVQFALDPSEDRTKGRYEADDYEYGLALVAGRPVVWRWTAGGGNRPGQVVNSELAIQRRPDGLTYELRLPLTELVPLVLLPNAQPGFTVLFNDADDSGRETPLEWTPGISGGKDPSSFGAIRIPETFAMADEVPLVQSVLKGSIFADEDEDYVLRVTVTTQRTETLTVRVQFRDAKTAELRLGESFSLSTPAGTSRYAVRAALRGIKPAQLVLELDVLRGEETLYHNAYRVFKYNSRLVR